MATLNIGWRGEATASLHAAEDDLRRVGAAWALVSQSGTSSPQISLNQLPTIVAPRPSSCSGAAYSQVPVSVSARPLLPTCTAVPKSHRLCAQACASAHAGQRAEGVRQRWAQEAGSGGGGRQRVASFIEQHIVGFEVAVDEATRVQVLEYEHERRCIEAHLE